MSKTTLEIITDIEPGEEPLLAIHRAMLEITRNSLMHGSVTGLPPTADKLKLTIEVSREEDEETP